jgi:hypothetical protein
MEYFRPASPSPDITGVITQSERMRLQQFCNLCGCPYNPTFGPLRKLIQARRSKQMCSFVRGAARAMTACILVALFVVPSGLLAQTHVVSPDELQAQVVAATQARQRNLDKVENFLSSPEAAKALGNASIDPQQVKTAVSSLSDAELAQLAARADKAQQDFAAGDLSERDLLLLILGIAVLVLIIVAVR